MAKQVITTFTDDLDGSPDAETVTFGLGGKTYEIDLGAKNRAALEKALDKFVQAARPVAGRGGVPRRSSKGNAKADLQAVREWARANGWPNLSDRGRVPQSVMEAFNNQ